MDAEFPLAELSPTDAAIVAMVRDGRPLAEVGVRLGLTGTDVRARLERLAESRIAAPNDDPPSEAATAVAGPARHAGSRRLAALAVVMAAALTAFGAWLLPYGDDAAGSEGGGSEDRERPGTPGAPQPATARVAMFEGRPWLNLGHVLEPEAIGLVTDRATMTVVRLTGRATLTLPGPAGAWRVVNTTGTASRQVLWLRGNVGGQETELMFRAFGGSWFEPLEPDSGVVEIDVAGVDVPMLVVGAFPVPDEDSVWPAHRPLAMDAGGRLLLGVGPLPLDQAEAFVAAAGDRTTAAGLPANLPGAVGLSTECAGEACSALVTATRDIGAPSAGVLGCRDGATWLEAAEFRLRLRAVVEGGRSGPPPCEESLEGSESRPVRSGEPIVLGAAGWIYELSAWEPNGRPLSVAVSRGGDLWVGKLAPTLR